MRRLISLLLAVLIIMAALSGCVQKSVFTGDNEILTYEKIDKDKTQIVVSRTGNIEVNTFCDKFEELNPDVQVIYIDITGGNTDYKPLSDWVIKGFTPDIVFSAGSFFEGALQTEHFENLSADSVISNYESEALKRTAVDGEVYSLPGPSDITAMVYNKTLFQQYGWDVPATFDEFVALCDQITEDTDGAVEPWNPNAKYSNEFITSFDAFTYEELFGGVENRQWYNNFIDGNETFKGHMEPFFEVIQTLADHGILKEEHFTYSATTRFNEFKAGNIAMINMNIFDDTGLDYDFGFMPFPTTQGEMGYLCDRYSCYVGMPVKEHTEKEADAIRRFMEFFSSAEGQQAYIGNSLMVSNVKDVPFEQDGDLAELEPAISAGHMFALLDFASVVGKTTSFGLQTFANDITVGAVTVDDCIEAVDAEPYIDAEEKTPPEVIAKAEDMTTLETSCYIADMYREAADADIGLIAHGVAYRGNLMRVFAGDITSAMVTVFKPRSFANDTTLVKVSMTGKQLLDALNNPAGNEEVADCIYAFSGLKAQVAPWNDLGSKYASVTLADGTAIENDTLYTVAIWDGTVAEQYITEVLEAFEGTWEDHMTAKLTKDGTVKPANDGRIKLIWK